MALDSDNVEFIENPGMQLAPDEYIEVYDLIGNKRYAGAAIGFSDIEKGIYLLKTPRGVFKKIKH